MSVPRDFIQAIVEQCPHMLEAHDEENPLPKAEIVVNGETYKVIDDESYDGKLQLVISQEGDTAEKMKTLCFWY